MSTFSNLAPREKAIEVLRWVCVLPAAVIASIAVRYLVGPVGRLAAYGWGEAAQSGFVHYFQLLLFYIPMEAAFVIAGAKMAPRGRIPTAIVLAVAAILISLATHILGQSVVGVVNYTHFALESIGAVLGAAFMLYSERAKRRNRMMPTNVEIENRRPAADAADCD